MATVLGFDYGLRRIGVAVGQSVTGTANPLKPIAARDGVPSWQAVEQLLTEWQPDLVVVGEPGNMDGSDSDMARRARKFANRVHGRFGVRIQLVDERLTSFAAKQEVIDQHGVQDFGEFAVDSIAAQMIVEQYFAESQQTSGKGGEDSRH